MSNLLEHIASGIQVGEFIVTQTLPRGKGGMATVCIAKPRYANSEVPDQVALKVSLRDHKDFLKLESDFLKELDHPHVIKVYPIPSNKWRSQYLANITVENIGQVYYYAMEYLAGGSLRTRLEKQKRLSLYETVTIGCQIALALEHIHERNIVNLDIKPDNILFRQTKSKWGHWNLPEAILCDFGIARNLRHPGLGIAMGSLPYISPEQAREIGKETPKNLAEYRSDIFALGVLLYETITGVVPFNDLGEIIAADYYPSPPSQIVPGVPTELDAVILKALAKKPEQRFKNANEMRRALAAMPRGLYWPGLAKSTVQVLLPTLLIIGLLIWAMQSIVPPPPTSNTPTPTLIIPTAENPAALPTIPVTPTATFTNTPPPTATRAPTRTSTPTPRPTFTPTTAPSGPSTTTPEN